MICQSMVGPFPGNFSHYCSCRFERLLPTNRDVLGDDELSEAPQGLHVPKAYRVQGSGFRV